MGAVDEDEVPLLDRLGESAREEERGCFEEDGDTSPDPGDRGLGDSQEVGDHHLGQVLAKDQQAGHHLVPQGGYGIWTDPSLDPRSHRRHGR